MTFSPALPDPPARAGDGNNAPDLDALPYAVRPAARALDRTVRRRQQQGQDADRSAARLAALLASAQAAQAARAALIPAQQTFDPDLPITAALDAIAAALATHQVIVISGATGSGKTTQLPRLCLHLGRGRLGRIGHTQPRRVAARTVAARIAAELGPTGPALVGHKVRFADETPPTAAIKLLTDGMLLAEARADPLLLEYDTLIVDEAHERSLNIDFLFGRLRTLIARRPELRVIIASATLEPQRIAEYFSGAPLLEVSGRTHPVEVRYRPPDGLELPAAVVGAVRELRAHGPGDVLVFLPGEREIRDCAAALRAAALNDTQVLALYARQSRTEQDRVFRPHGQPRVVLATNVAETSLTVPGVRYVVDSGLARIARYSASGHMARLPVERIAQASAIQRAGRCGRLGPGVCIRLYDEDDHDRRPPFPEPEIRRAPLAAVVLQMRDAGLDPHTFPFLDAPDARQLREAHAALHALGALEGEHLTPLGRRLAQFPLDPRLARMLIEADRTGALAELLVIVAGLSVPDARVRPHEAAARADAHHRVFADPRSDFLGLLKLYRAFADLSRGQSQRKARTWCEDNDLSYPRLREWREVESQLRTLAHEVGLHAASAPADYTAVHRAVLAGLVDRVAAREPDPAPAASHGTPRPGTSHPGRTRRAAPVYRAAHGTALTLHPGSALVRRPPRWIVAAEVVATTRTYARTVAGIEPAWLEAQARHLLRSSWTQPRFDPARQDVVADEHVSLLGLPLLTRTRRRYAVVDAAAARAVFIREALVGDALQSPSPALTRTRARIADLRAWEAKTRRPDLLADDDALFGVWDARLGPGIASAYTFEHWRRHPDAEAALDVPTDHLLAPGAALPAEPAAWPDGWDTGAAHLPLHYVFDPAQDTDGATLTVPLPVLPDLPDHADVRLIAAWRPALCEALIRSLPRALRRHCVPVPDTARACAARLDLRAPLRDAVAAALSAIAGTAITAQDFADDALPPWLQLRLTVVDAGGAVLGSGRDPGHLKARFGPQAQAAFARRAPHALERDVVTTWDFGTLPDHVDLPGPGGTRLRGYPALVDDDGTCALRVLPSADAAHTTHAHGMAALLRARLLREHPGLLPRGDALRDAALIYAPLGRGTDLETQLHTVVVHATFLGGALPRDEAAWQALWSTGLERVGPLGARLAAALGDTLRRWQALRRTLRGGQTLALLEAHADVGAQLDALVYPGFVERTGAQLEHLPRYLRAAQIRLERAGADPQRDRTTRARLAPYLAAVAALDPVAQASPAGQHLRWQTEELRVALFAQELGTPAPVSTQRLDALLARLRA